MEEKQEFNVGSIHDVQIGKGFDVNVSGAKIALFRETYDKFYALEDEILGIAGSISKGTIERGKIRLRYGKTVDMRTGQCDDSDHFIRTFHVWVEGQFIFVEHLPLFVENSQMQEESPAV